MRFFTRYVEIFQVLRLVLKCVVVPRGLVKFNLCASPCENCIFKCFRAIDGGGVRSLAFVT